MYRYQAKDNIIWVNGGDRNGDCYNDSLAIFRALGEGLKSRDNNHLVTLHPSFGGSYTWFHNDPWLDFNMIQIFDQPEKTSSFIHDGYLLSPNKPIINAEPAYYGYGTETERTYRSQPYRTMLAGGSGFNYGQKYVWYFDKGTDGNDGSTMNSGDEDGDWFDYLDTPATLWTVTWKEFFSSLEWHELVPAQELILSNTGSGLQQKVAAKMLDGSKMVVYFPVGGTATISLSAMSSSSLHSRWFNPKNGGYSSVTTFSKAASRPFTSPSSGEVKDWVLLIED